jgi:clan AA aspartic protease (TIGR02281 family)
MNRTFKAAVAALIFAVGFVGSASAQYDSNPSASFAERWGEPRFYFDEFKDGDPVASNWGPNCGNCPAPKQATQGHVPLKMDGGTFIVPVQINGTMTLDFVVDSGASDVSVPADVVSTLMRVGTIKETDFIGEQTYILADGSKSRSPTFMIRSLRVGDVVLENVKGSITPSQGGLLLGQSFLKRFKSWSIDNTEQKLLLEPR